VRYHLEAAATARLEIQWCHKPDAHRVQDFHSWLAQTPNSSL
jgi:hypothetical protein